MISWSSEANSKKHVTISFLFIHNAEFEIIFLLSLPCLTKFQTCMNHTEKKWNFNTDPFFPKGMIMILGNALISVIFSVAAHSRITTE